MTSRLADRLVKMSFAFFPRSQPRAPLELISQGDEKEVAAKQMSQNQIGALRYMVFLLFSIFI
jgi:hypothetical protein